MRARVLIAVVLGVGFAGSARPQGTVVGSVHDMRAVGGLTPTGTGLNEVCVVCHTPHQTAGANGQDPLWNHTGTSTASFGVYASATLNATPTDIGGAAMGSQPASLLCMSCHDGTVSVLSMYNPPSPAGTVTPVGGRIDASGRIISTNNMGTSLTDDHPINFTYDSALVSLDPGLRDPTVAPISNWLVGGTVQCSTCHDAHDPTNRPFLRISNVASALCTTCHIK